MFSLNIEVFHGGEKNVLIISLIISFDFSIGGKANLQTVVTLPSMCIVNSTKKKFDLYIENIFIDILRQINPQLDGYSTGVGNRDSKDAGFNVARAGAVSV